MRHLLLAMSTCAFGCLELPELPAYSEGSDAARRDAETHDSDASDPSDVTVNMDSELGDLPDLPDLPEAPGPWVQVSVGGAHVCALDRMGDIYCWGNNSQGQLGVGDNLLRDKPTIVSRVAGQAFDVVAAGDLHTCALAGGNAYCWGGNLDRQVHSNAGPWYSPTPAELADALVRGPTSSVGAGNSHSCAPTTANLVRCWGKPADNRLGDGSAPIHSIALGDTLGCGIHVDSSRAVCWGDLFGEDTGGVWYPSTFGTTHSSISVGSDHGCAIVQDGTVECFGSNRHFANGFVTYKCGHTLADDDVNSRLVPAITDAKAIAAGTNHTCVIWGLERIISCWGWSSRGEAGWPDGVRGAEATPQRVGSVEGFDSISAGFRVTCAISDGEIFCWGGNEAGQLGGGTQDARTDHVTPELVLRPET